MVLLGRSSKTGHKMSLFSHNSPVWPGREAGAFCGEMVAFPEGPRPRCPGSFSKYSFSMDVNCLRCQPALPQTKTLNRQELGATNQAITSSLCLFGLEKGMATHSSILAWRIPWTEEPGRLQSMGWQRVDHDWVTNTSLHFIVFGSSLVVWW